MAVVKGLASIKRHQEKQAEKASNGKKFPEMFFRIFPKVVGNEVVVRFLQELDPGMDNYREDRGIGLIAVEHQAGAADNNSDQAPKKGFMYKALCSIDDEEQCYGCERHKQNYKGGWRPQQSLYINVAVVVDGETKVYVLSRSANSTFVQSLIQEAVDEGSITDANYRITKTGDGTQTQWLLKRLKGEPIDDSGVELWDIEGEVLKTIPYSEQPAFFSQAHDGGAKVVSESANETVSRPSAPADDEW